MSLQPCPSCSRHVRATEVVCPFCAASIALQPLSSPVVSERLGRAALFAFGAAMATNVAACSMSSTPAVDSGAPVDANATPVDSGRDAAGNPDAGVSPPYGAPPDDTGLPDGGQDGGLAGAYGAPPFDAGR